MTPISRRRVAQFIADQLSAGESVAHVAKMLAAWLVDNKQTRNAEILLLDIESELLRRHGHLAAEVFSAREISSELRDSLETMLKQETGAKTIEIMPAIDKSLVGGVVVRTPDSELDASLKTKLNKLRTI